MSILGGLLKLGGIVAAPFTGGASLVPTILSTAGDVAGAMSKGRADARVAEAGLNAGQDRLSLDRAQIAQRMRQGSQSEATRGAFLEGLQDFSIERPEGVAAHKITGGLRPSAITGGSAIGKQFKEDALARLMADNETPALTPVPQASGFDKFLNILSGVGGISDIVGSFGKGKSGAPGPMTGTYVKPTFSSGFKGF